MASVNKAIIVGNLGKDPELRYTTAGQSVCNFGVCTTDKWTDKASGQTQERKEWHRIVVWGKQAENCAKYLKKGRSVYIEGQLHTHEVPDPKNSSQKRYFTEIIASTVQFLGNGKSSENEPDLQAGQEVEKQPECSGFTLPQEFSRFTPSEPLNLKDDSDIPF